MSAAASRQLISFGPFEFDAASGLLFRGEQETLLPPRASGVLHCLLQQPGEMVTKETLLETVWKDAFVGEHSLTRAVSVVRHALGDDSNNPTYIQTIPRRGYRFIAELERGVAAEEEMEGAAGRPAIPAVRAAPVPVVSVGDSLGQYEILAELGAGAMGVVYRARDTVLEREVAIKVLPEEFVSDPGRVARFEREAKLLASVSHPNIASIHSLEEADGVKFPVLELVEGETLDQRLLPGPLEVDEALEIGRQIASALEAAHKSGVIHRDLKPANIKLTPEGQVKVLDFGLAKALEVHVFGAEASDSPTESMTIMGSRRGSIAGTAAYMSPEQARGEDVDRRADIWSFGCVLYELFTGRRAFAGETVSDTIAGVLEREPDWEDLPPETPRAAQRVLRRCLTKDPQHRLHDIADARIEIEEAQSDPGGDLPVVAPAVAAQSPLWRRAIRWGAGIAVGAIVAGLAVWSLMRSTPTAPQPPMRFDIELPADVNLTRTGRHAVAISPAGTHLVFSANEQLYVRAMDDPVGVLVPLRGTEGGGRNPFFSPDGQWVGFYAEYELRKVPISGGAAVKLCDADNPHGASWGDDQILYGQGAEGIWRVSTEEGEPVQLIEMAEGDLAHGPQVLPDGEWVLYTLLSGSNDWNDAQIVLQSLATDDRKLLVPAGKDARYLPTGHLVYTLDDELFARPFDLSRMEFTGEADSVIQGVRGSAFGDHLPSTGAAHFSFSDLGGLVYLPSVVDSSNNRLLVWVDRDGNPTPVTERRPDLDLGHPSRNDANTHVRRGAARRSRLVAGW